MIIALLGGISSEQIIRVEAVTLASALVAGSLGSMIACGGRRRSSTRDDAACLGALALGLGIVAAIGADSSWLGLPAKSWRSR